MSTPLFPAPNRLTTPLEPAFASATASRARRQALDANDYGQVAVAVASSCGTQHPVNEDAHSALDGPGRLFVVADGVGGGAMAQTASRLLVLQLHEALDPAPIDAESVSAAVLDADRTIAGEIARVTARPGAATVAMCAPADVSAARWLIAWVGDCRAYRIAMAAEPGIDLLTCDDTFANLGEAPPPGGSLDDPARMVGNGAVSGANVALHDLARGDVLALCSDGVHKHVEVADWCRLLAQRVPLARICQELIAVARTNGSRDDATVLLLQRARAPQPGLRRTGRTAGPAGSARRER